VPKQKTLAISNVDSFFDSAPGGKDEAERTLESHLLRQLIAEFRQLRLEVAELKGEHREAEMEKH